MATVLADAPGLHSWLKARDPEQHWWLNMRGVFGEPVISGAVFCWGRRAVTLEEMVQIAPRVQTNGLSAARHRALGAATDAIEAAAAFVPEAVYKDLYDAVKKLNDSMDH